MDTVWPAVDRTDNSIIEGIDYTLLNKAVDSAFGNEAPHYGTRALLVIYKDQLLAEKYADGFDAQTGLWQKA